MAEFDDPKLRDTAQAVRLARRAVELEPSSPDRLLALGVAQLRAADARESARSLTRAARLRRICSPETELYLAMAEADLDRSAARERLARARAWLEQNGTINQDVGRLLTEANRIVDASIRR